MPPLFVRAFAAMGASCYVSSGATPRLRTTVSTRARGVRVPA